MPLRRAQSGRFPARDNPTPYFGADRRRVRTANFGGAEQRRSRSAPLAAAMPAPPSSAAIVTPTIANAGRNEAANPAPAVVVRTPTQAEIARRAEQLYCEHNCLPGRDRENWYEAEAELRARACEEAFARHRELLEAWYRELADDALANPELYDERLWLSRLIWT